MAQKGSLWESAYNRLTGKVNKHDNNQFVTPIEKKELITASSKEELEDKKLEYQQTQYLYKQHSHIIQQNDMQAVQANALRLPAYVEYKMMESYPIIAQALNVLAEEATTIGDRGQMLNIYSNNNRLKEDLEYLFYEILDINTNLPFWIRNTIKFGDNFIFIMTEADKGVVNVKQLPTSEIERQEKIINGKATTKFIWQLGGQEYTNFQVAHFRLLGDENTLPYGTSVLAPVRMYYRMLKMSEDAQLVYRATNAARVKVVKVPTGNMDPTDIPMFMRQTISNFKKSQIVDPATGQINYKYSPASGVEDIFVAVKNAGDPSPIDILEGADNLDKIADIEYLRDNLFTGLGVPKNRLNFSGSGEGGGDSSAQTDIVFSRKVMRIQNAMIQELNKIALIHLFLLGYSDDDIRDYKLTLNNPSTQSEILKIEAFTQKVDLYVKLTTSNETGLKPMSETNAKKLIFGLSADEILDDIKQQMIENVVGDEIKNAGLILKKSGIFNDLEEYIKRGIITSSLDPAQVNGEQPAEPGADAMGGPMDMGNNPAGGAAPQGEQEPFQLKEKYLYRANKTNNELVQLLKEVEDKTSLSQNSNETVQLLNEFLNKNNKL